MNNRKFLKGPALFALARKKARALGIESESLKLADLICRVQEQEGYVACFRRKRTCAQRTCCWQQSCGAEMMTE